LEIATKPARFHCPRIIKQIISRDETHLITARSVTT
jgi:hypothetical protein